MPYKDREKQRQAQHEAYLRNKEKYQVARRKHQRNSVEFLRQLKSGPCIDCGGQFHYSQMDFDHVRGDKKFELNRMNIVSKSRQAVLDEIENAN